MNRYLYFILPLVFLSMHVKAEYCNWGFSGAKAISCDGEQYYYGTAACSSGIYQNVFCHENFYGSGKACAEDNSAKTTECYNKMIGQVTPKAEKKNSWCNWGFSGPKIVKCRGKKYCYGTAACGSEIYQNVFCEERFCTTGKACADDNSSDTVACYKQHTGKTPRSSLNSSGWPSPKSKDSEWPASSKGVR